VKKLRAAVGVVVVTTALGTVVAPASPAAAAAAAKSRTLYVAPTASGGSGNSCAKAGYRSVTTAIDRAAAGDTVHVCAGTYAESVAVDKAVTVAGEANAVIDATGENVGIEVTASGATVTGLTVRNATGQGIFVHEVKKVTIAKNTVDHNDLGVGTSTYLYCTSANFVADCGEGLHLSGVSSSTITGNTITNNSGGILVSDELGPTHHTTISDNTVTDNTKNCGITIVGHNADAYTADGKVAPEKAGVYKNTVNGNAITNNGTTGTGAGILLATPRAGMAVYRNTVSRNTITGNGLAGVQLNENTSGQHLADNLISDNIIGTNNLLHSTTAGDGSTVGISTFVAPGAGALTVTVTGNAISDNAYGIYTGAGTTLTQSGNTFTNVTTPLAGA
jgi:parallel beta-helix repeat protein